MSAPLSLECRVIKGNVIVKGLRIAVDQFGKLELLVQKLRVIGHVCAAAVGRPTRAVATTSRAMRIMETGWWLHKAILRRGGAIGAARGLWTGLVDFR